MSSGVLPLSQSLFQSDSPAGSRPLRGLLLIHVGLLVLFVANALRSAIANSAVCDELGAHIPAGYLYWSSGQWSGGLSNFPLGQLLIAAPVHFLGHSYQLYTEEHLLLFRLPGIAMGVLLGGLLAHLATRLYGQRAGLAAAFCYALSPNILAHTALATLDLPTAFFVFLVIYILHGLVDKATPLRVLALALAMGLALVSKIQAIALIGLVPIILAIFWRRIWLQDGRMRLLAAFLIAPLITIALINWVYLHVPNSSQWLPPDYISAISGKLLHGSRGHFSYLMGEYGTTGWWYYFPIAIGLKTPLPVLMLVAVGIFRRPSLATGAFVLAPLGVFLALGLVANVDIGLRHVLIVYPFLFLLAARGVVALQAAARGRIALAVLAAAYTAQAIFISPHHLSYFNLLVGGPTQGHYYLIDSNYDWGQNDHFLRQHVEASDAIYQINPGAFRPVEGRVLVNANALYGVLNGGPDAYRWLKSFEATRRIAYTWFEYEIPYGAFQGGVQQPDAISRRSVVEHLLALQERYADVPDILYRLLLARSFSSLGAHDVAFEGIRRTLADHPASELALATGGELIVRHKLGVLPFEADQYLSGVQTRRPADPQLLAGEELVRRSRAVGMGRTLSGVYGVLGAALSGDQRKDDAREVLRLALRLDPANESAARNLKLLR